MTMALTLALLVFLGVAGSGNTLVLSFTASRGWVAPAYQALFPFARRRQKDLPNANSHSIRFQINIARVWAAGLRRDDTAFAKWGFSDVQGMRRASSVNALSFLVVITRDMLRVKHIPYTAPRACATSYAAPRLRPPPRQPRRSRAGVRAQTFLGFAVRSSVDFCPASLPEGAGTYTTAAAASLILANQAKRPAVRLACRSRSS